MRFNKLIVDCICIAKMNLPNVVILLFPSNNVMSQVFGRRVPMFVKSSAFLMYHNGKLTRKGAIHNRRPSKGNFYNILQVEKINQQCSAIIKLLMDIGSDAGSKLTKNGRRSLCMAPSLYFILYIYNEISISLA